MTRFLKKHGKWLSVIAFLMLCATVAGGYILTKQRLANPFASYYTVNADFSNTAGLNPGLGQAVNVAGVRVGTITSAELRGGLAHVNMQIKPGKLKHVYADAHAVLVPNSPLKDMQVELYPGHPQAGAAPGSFTIPVARTAPPVDSDELTAALDTDTRRYFQVLVNGVDKGLDGRSADVQALIRSLKPTAQQLEQVSSALAGRRRQLRRLVHSMAVLTTATASKDVQLGQVIQGGNATITALANQAAGKGLGNINPTLYKLGSAGRCFHDVTIGDNHFHSDPGEPARDGWDLPTGWGTPDAGPTPGDGGARGSGSPPPKGPRVDRGPFGCPPAPPGRPNRRGGALACREAARPACRRPTPWRTHARRRTGRSPWRPSPCHFVVGVPVEPALERVGEVVQSVAVEERAQRTCRRDGVGSGEGIDSPAGAHRVGQRELGHAQAPVRMPARRRARKAGRFVDEQAQAADQIVRQRLARTLPRRGSQRARGGGHEPPCP